MQILVYAPAGQSATAASRKSKRSLRTTEEVHAYDTIELPDGKALICSSAPRAVISVLDLQDLSLEAFIPEALAENFRVTGPKTLDAETLLVMTNTGGVLLSYPGFDTIARIPNPQGVTFGLKTCAHAGSAVAWGANRPWILDPTRREWQPLTDEPVGDPHPGCPETCVAMASLEDGSLVGVTDSSCIFWRLQASSRETSGQTIELTGLTDGAPLAIGGGRAWGSSHAVQRFWSVDLQSGEGRDLGQCSLAGQACSMTWDREAGRLFMGNYPESRIRIFDPARPPAFPENPGIFAEFGSDFVRPSHQLLKVGESLWTCANATWPRLGGAVFRVDSTTGEVEIFRDLLPGESPGEMILGHDGHTLYFGTTVHADCGQNIPVSPAAHMAAFDSREGKLRSAHRPVDRAETLSALCLDAAGRVLFLDGPRLTRGRSLWAWDLFAGSFERIGSAPDGLREILTSPEGRELWATAFEGTGPLSLGTECRIDFSRGFRLAGNGWDQRMCKYLQWDPQDPGVLWCVCFAEVLRFRVV